jgi:hypothetical protein
MKFLADQDVYAATTRFITGLGHNLVRAAQLGLATAEMPNCFASLTGTSKYS